MTCHRIECMEIEKALKEKLTQVEAELVTAKKEQARYIRECNEHWGKKHDADYTLISMLYDQLAASQAREQVLRDALQFYGGGLTLCGNTAELALSTPSDDTALRQWGAKLLEELAVEAASETWSNGFAQIIRNKAKELEDGK